jgi:hypothetical protein
MIALDFSKGLRERRERERALMSEPDFIDSICDEIACSTKTLTDISQTYDIRYHELYKWVHGDPDRLALYAKALEARNANLQDRVLRALVRVAEFDVRELYDDSGNIKSVKDLPEHVAKVIGSMDMEHVNVDGQIVTKIAKVKTADRMRGIENIGRATSMFTDKVEHSGTIDGLADRMAAARERTKQAKVSGADS